VERRGLAIEIHENKVLPGVHSHRHQPIFRAIEVTHAFELHHSFERAVVPVRPAVIGAAELFRAALRFRHDRRGMVPAHVVKPAQSAIFPACHDDGFTRESGREKISFLSHLVCAANHLPRPAKHTLLLELFDLRVEIPRRGNGPSVVQRIVGIVQIQKIANISFHEAAPWQRHTNSTQMPSILDTPKRFLRKAKTTSGRPCAFAPRVLTS
jgi:hypothetical protein